MAEAEDRFKIGQMVFFHPRSQKKHRSLSNGLRFQTPHLHPRK